MNNPTTPQNPPARQHPGRGSIVAVIPARNEESTIAPVVQEAARHVTQVLVVNDCSTDGTNSTAKHHGARVLDLQKPSGYSAALLEGCKFALAEGHATIVMLDADGAHDPCDIPNVLRVHAECCADLTIGDRFYAGASPDIPSTKRWANHFATHLVNLVLDTRTLDAACGFRVLTSRYAYALLDHGPMPGFSLAFHCIALARRKSFRMASAPISVRYDATELAYTRQHEFLDLLAACTEHIPETKPAFAAVAELKGLVERLAPATVIIGDLTLCLHPLEQSGYVFQRQPSCFSKTALGPIVNIDEAFNHLFLVER
jgi:glycosyltransferase involved in cell wall biosynthesis